MGVKMPGYYRLNVFPMEVPPLRERMEDVPLLAKHFVETSVKELGCPKPRLTRAGIAKLGKLSLARQHPRTAERHRTGHHHFARRRARLRFAGDRMRGATLKETPRQ